MNIQPVSATEYLSLFPQPTHIYNNVAFCELNSSKCDEVSYLLLSDDHGRLRFGLIAGAKGGELRSPFSAPFGGIQECGRQKATMWVEAVEALRQYLGYTPLRIILPPMAYDSDGPVTRQLQALLSAGAKVMWSDYNYHLDLNLLREGDYLKSLDRNVRNKYNASLRHGFEFKSLPGATPADLAEAHRIVLANHTALGYPVHLSAADLVDTSGIIPMDVFLLSLEGVNIASAIVYHNAPGALQLIYWGDLPEFRHLHPMNFMAYNLFSHYAAMPGMRIFDMGPSSSEGIPSRGLCDFKEGLGCTLTAKFTIRLN
ncbi:MAG: hypothetical protein NC339_07125 [Muribaculaceae bacterium]|nr:hypothetical protein [Muribaculaceae bacterium]